MALNWWASRSPQEKAVSVVVWGGLLGVLVTIWLVAGLFTSGPQVSSASRVARTEPDDTFLQSLVVSKAELNKALKDPDSARFSDVSAYPTTVADGGRVYYFCGRVNAKNGFGGYTGNTRFIATPKGAVVETDPSFGSAWIQRCGGSGRPVPF